MTLNRKVQLLIGAVFIVEILILYLFLKNTLVKSFTGLERHYASRTVQDATAVLKNKINFLNDKSFDWASWDDAYNFIEDANPAFIKSNLPVHTFTGMKINIMLFIHSSGRVVYAKSYDYKTGKELAIWDSLLKALAPQSPLVRHTSTDSVISGMLVLPDGVLMLSSRPILTSEKKGPIRGTLIFGTFLDEAEIKNISETVHSPVSIYRPSTKDISAISRGITVKPMNNKTISGYSLINDVFGRPGLVLKVDMPRDIFSLGTSVVYQYVFWQILVYLLLGFLGYWIVNYLILKRTAKIFQIGEYISRSGDITPRLKIEGSDDIAQVAVRFNKMLDRLKKTQDELQEQKIAYQTLVDNATDAIWTTDMLLRFTYASPAGLELSGYTLEEILGHPVAELLTPASLKKAREVFLEELAIEGRQKEHVRRPPRLIELEQVRKDGSIIWTDVHMSFLRGPDGQPSGIIGISHDISQRKRVEKELKEAKAFTESTLNSITDIFYSFDLSGKFLSWNKTFSRISGYSDQELSSKKPMNFFLGEDIQRIAEAVERIYKEGTAKTEANFVLKDGRQILCEFTGSILKDDKGNIIGFSGTARDITERKHAEQLLIKFNECFLNFGPDPNENIQRLTALCGELLQATAAFYNHLEGENLRSIGQWNAPADFVPEGPAQGHICYDVIQRAAKEIVTLHNLPETKYAQSDPNVLKYQLKTYFGKVVEANGTSVGSLCVVYQKDSELTEEHERVIGIIAVAIGTEEERKLSQDKIRDAYVQLRESQEQLIQAKKIEAIGILASGVAHEVKNPLAIIIQGVDYLQRKVKGKEALEIIRTIKNSVERADRIVRAVVDFSQFSGLELLPQDINAVLEESLTLLKYRIDLANTELIKELGQGLPLVLGDKGKLVQVFINLFNNSIQAMPSGGKLFLRTYQTEAVFPLDKDRARSGVSASEKEKAVAIEIEDTGVGISSQDLSRIFDPFFTTKGPTEGAGLGLSVVKTIIDMHNADIKVESQEHKGTKIIVALRAVK